MRQRLVRFAVVLLLCMFAFSSLPVLAAGDGSGGGQDEPLALASSFPAHGAVGVSQQVQIKLTFNKNVVNMSVRDNNRQCFSLTSGGQTIPIDIIMADDQVQPEGKRDVVLKPRQSLAAGTPYTVTIASTLQAKSGAVLGKTVVIGFTTAGAAASVAAPTPSVNSDQGGSAAAPPSNPINVQSNDAAGQNVSTGKDSTNAVDPSPAQNTIPTKSESQASDNPVEENQPQQGPDYDFLIIIKGGLLLAVILAYVLVRYRRK